MLTFSEIKKQYKTCSDDDVDRLKSYICEFMSLDKSASFTLSAWPYTQIMCINYPNGKTDWIGICDKTSVLSRDKSCDCGQCKWSMGLM